MKKIIVCLSFALNLFIPSLIANSHEFKINHFSSEAHFVNFEVKNKLLLLPIQENAPEGLHPT